VRQIRETTTTDGETRYRVRYRLNGKETSETFRTLGDAEMFRDILGDGSGTRVTQALSWLEGRRNQHGGQSAFTFGAWFELYVDQLTGVSDRTRSDYRSMHRRYLSHLDALPLDYISRAHVTGIVNDLDRKGRSPKTIKQAVHMLSTCLQLAIDERHITANPCRNVRLPRQQLGGTEARFLTHEEAGLLIESIPEHYRPLVTFLFGTGLRWSEATALQARHIDLEAGTVRVEQAWKRVPGDGYVIGTPKTAKSRRTVNAAVAALVAVEPLLRKPSDLIFLTRSGGPVSHANFYNNVWKPACERARFDPAPRIHDARHSHASWLISDGKMLESVQDQLGHESILTTRKVYGHLLPALGVEVGRSASAAMERVLAHRSQLRAIEGPGVGDANQMGHA